MINISSKQVFFIRLFLLLIIHGIRESVGLCSNSSTVDETSLLSITFESGSELYSDKKPSDYNFNTSYQQQFPSKMVDGQFGFVNAVPNSYASWHANALDHTPNDNNGYMYLVVVGNYGSQIFNSIVHNLTVDRCYHFSAYLANIIRKYSSNAIKPNIRFEVRSTTDENILLAEYNTGDIPEYENMTWFKYGFSFNVSHSSVVLLMISNVNDSGGNDIAIDDIELKLLDLCSDSNMTNETSFLLITFGSGVNEYSGATPAYFSFSTTHEQKHPLIIQDGQFGFVNAVIINAEAWHGGALDHTSDADSKGYMYLVNIGGSEHEIFRSTVNNLCVGRCYHFSAYLANIVKKLNLNEPNIRFEVRETTHENISLAQCNTNDIPEYDNLTWSKYGVSFNASHSSVVLLMISIVNGGGGDDIVIDDIKLSMCSTDNLGYCSSETTSITPAVTTVSVDESTNSNSISISIMTTTQLTTKEQTSTTYFISSSQFDTVASSLVPQSTPSYVSKPCNTSVHIGLFCNVSNNLCDMLEPCQNNGTCNSTDNNQRYKCSCLSGFNGINCEFDHRPCKSYTCLDHGNCNETSNTTFNCTCHEGWQGLHCESMINFCKNNPCLNRGVCRPLVHNYKCECLDGYSGQYCENIAKRIVIYQIVSKSLSYIAIIAIASVAMFVIIMDILKYCFGIDPVEIERKKLRREKQAKRPKRPVIERFVYVNASVA